MSLLSFQEDRINLIEEIFDLFDSENLGYVEIKDSLKILASIGKKLDIEDENDFLSLIDPKNEGRVSKENFIRGVEEMFTLPKDFLEEVEDALKFFDRNDKGKVSCKELKNLLPFGYIKTKVSEAQKYSFSEQPILINIEKEKDKVETPTKITKDLFHNKNIYIFSDENENFKKLMEKFKEFNSYNKHNKIHSIKRKIILTKAVN